MKNRGQSIRVRFQWENPEKIFVDFYFPMEFFRRNPWQNFKLVNNVIGKFVYRITIKYEFDIYFKNKFIYINLIYSIDKLLKHGLKRHFSVLC